MEKLILKNNKQREQFLICYHDWMYLGKCEITGFDYYRYTFEDGTYITVVEFGEWKGNLNTLYNRALMTITYPGRPYIPISSNKGEMMEYLTRNVPNKEA